MPTFEEVLSKAIRSGRMKMVRVNQNMMEIARKTKKKPAFVKTAISDELAKELMLGKKVAFIVHMDGDELNQFAKEIDSEANAFDNNKWKEIWKRQKNEIALLQTQIKYLEARLNKCVKEATKCGYGS